MAEQITTEQTQKALTKEDLIYILQTLFKIADTENNALTRNDNGLYVESFSGLEKELKDHKEDSDIHITSTIRQILDKMSVDGDNLLYNGKPVTTMLSQQPDNALTMDEDGSMYVHDYHADKHIEDDSIHVTKDKKDEWDAMLDESKQYCLDEIGKLSLTKFEMVNQLPTENISSETLYLLSNTNEAGQLSFLLYVYVLDKWLPCIMSKEKLEVVFSEHIHDHTNKKVIDLFTEVDGRVLYDGKDMFALAVKEDDTNAARFVDGELYVKDFSKELESMEKCAAFTKINLYNELIDNSGKYQLKDDINNYNLLLVEYYYNPDKPGEPEGCAKTAVIDVDVINKLYDESRDYMLEYGYGIMTSNSKIRIHEDTLWVDYYHNVCIYRITGIRKGDD